jgi:peptide/nickel transport system permease protein
MIPLDAPGPAASDPERRGLGALGRHAGPLRRRLRILGRDPTSMAGLVIVAIVILVAVVGPWLAPHDPNAIDIVHKFAGPSTRFPLGADYLGRDTLSRLLYGARQSIQATLIATVSITAMGVILGMLAGFLGGIVDAAISWVVDLLLAFPSLLLGLAITAVLGPGLGHVTLSIIVVWWTGYARIVRAAVLAERNKLYVEAAAAIGSTSRRTLLRHVLPNIVAPIVVYTSLEMGSILLAISALSFLGLGVNPPTAEWGAMLSSAKTYIDLDPQLMIYPGAAIFIFALGCNLVGDGLRDFLDPKTLGDIP